MEPDVYLRGTPHQGEPDNEQQQDPQFGLHDRNTDSGQTSDFTPTHCTPITNCNGMPVWGHVSIRECHISTEYTGKGHMVYVLRTTYCNRGHTRPRVSYRFRNQIFSYAYSQKHMLVCRFILIQTGY